MRSDIESCESLDDLFNRWEKQENHDYETFVRDGFISSKWGSKKKILFILKEAYLKRDKDGKVENCEHDVRDWLSNEEGFYDLLDGKYKNFWRRIVEWTYCINETDTTKIAPFPSDLFEKTNKKVAADFANSIAIMNLKKSDGKTVSNKKDIRQYVKNDSEFIKRQIELISPDIIVCGHILDILDKNVYNSEIKSRKCDDWFYNTKKMIGRNTIVIDYYHPSAWSTKIKNWIDPEVRYYKRAECYQKALISEVKK